MIDSHEIEDRATPPAVATASEAAIEIERHPVEYPRFDAVVTLRGEHDVASEAAIDGALASVRGDVLVNLSECTFCDSSVVRVLFEADRRRRLEDQRLELLVPDARASIARIFEITRLGSRVTIHRDHESIAAATPTTLIG
jgi:anti-anti-sigma factor